MVILSSFYNEEYLLPWWLEHHKGMFDHGILFNHFSDDRSAEIVKEICPTWEVRDTELKDWDFEDFGEEYMDAEREIDGYKMILTTTEFLMSAPELPEEPTSFAIPMIRMADNEPDRRPTHDKPLVEQKHFGFADRGVNRYRFLHNYPDGGYGLGIHKTKHKTTKSPNWIYKYVFSPWTEEFIERKLQMVKYMSVRDKKLKRAKHHFWDRDELDRRHKRAVERSSNI